MRGSTFKNIASSFKSIKKSVDDWFYGESYSSPSPSTVTVQTEPASDNSVSDMIFPAVGHSNYPTNYGYGVDPFQSSYLERYGREDRERARRREEEFNSTVLNARRRGFSSLSIHNHLQDMVTSDSDYQFQEAAIRESDAAQPTVAGIGLRAQMEQSNTVHYNTFTSQDLEDTIRNLDRYDLNGRPNPNHPMSRGYGYVNVKLYSTKESVDKYDIISLEEILRTSREDFSPEMLEYAIGKVAEYNEVW